MHFSTVIGVCPEKLSSEMDPNDPVGFILTDKIAGFGTGLDSYVAKMMRSRPEPVDVNHPTHPPVRPSRIMHASSFPVAP
jgi:hypothetical protein